MISGECRVEGIPSPGSVSADRRLAIDGLRLQLDLRILPGIAGGDATAAAIWRIESENVATLPLRVPATLRRTAVATAVAFAAVSFLASGLWFAKPSPLPPDGRGSTELPVRAAPVPAPQVARTNVPPAPAPAPEPAAASSRTDEVPPSPSPEGPHVAPRIAIVPAKADPEANAAPPAPARTFAAPSSGASTPKSASRSAPLRAAPAVATTAQPTARAASTAARPLDADHDMLDLFGDTK